LTDLLRRSGGRFLRVGHRGAAALEPENTIAAFRRAVELDVDFVEFDVFDLADGTLVLAHSDDLLEVSHGAATGRVRHLRLEELREAAPHLPTLDEALEFFGSVEAGLHVDVKCYRRGRDVATALRRHRLVDRAVASSFWPTALRDLRAAEPELLVGLTYPDDRHGLARRRLVAPLVPPAVSLLARVLPRRLPRWLRETDVAVAMLHWAVLSRKVVDRCHRQGVAVWTWTVNEPALLERVLALGVDGVISDDPRLFLQ
jgi:glycerophosphoryl diester phosphodiesterase